MFDEEPDGHPHGECAEEIARLKVANIKAVADLERLTIEHEELTKKYQTLRLDAMACAKTLEKARCELGAANAACRTYEQKLGILFDAVYGALAQLDEDDGLFAELHGAVANTNICLERGCPQYGKTKASTCGCQERQ